MYSNKYTALEAVDILKLDLFGWPRLGVDFAQSNDIMQTCTCGAMSGAVRSRIAGTSTLRSIGLRGLSTSWSQSASQPNFVNEESPARQARREAEASRQRRSGPFPFAQPQLDETIKIPWRELTAGEKVGRTIGNSSKL